MVRIDNSKETEGVWSIEGGRVKGRSCLPLAPCSLISRSTGAAHLPQPGDEGAFTSIKTVSSDGTTAALSWQFGEQNSPHRIGSYCCCCGGGGCCCCCCCWLFLNCHLGAFLVFSTDILGDASVWSTVVGGHVSYSQHGFGPEIIFGWVKWNIFEDMGLNCCAKGINSVGLKEELIGITNKRGYKNVRHGD